MGHFKETNAFLVYVIFVNETVHEKWSSAKSVRQSKNGLERGFVNMAIKLHWNNWPINFFAVLVAVAIWGDFTEPI